MKKLSLILSIILLIVFAAPSVIAETEAYTEAPMLSAKVEAGELPNVTDRLPEVPEIINDAPAAYLTPEKGVYGGTLYSVSNMINYDSHAFVVMTESILTLDFSNGEVYDNVLMYDVNEDATEFTFTIRKGMKWSDGEPVTMEDFTFTWNNFLNNASLTPAIAAKLCSGGKLENGYLTFEVVDDYTFKLISSEPYGGLLLNLTFTGFPGYCDILKPSHYLKQFHPDYATECHGSIESYYEFIRPFAEVLGYDDPTAENVWVYVFNAIDMTNWEMTDPGAALTSSTFSGLIDKNFPVLYPWIMESVTDTIVTYVRNPYYFKVDQWGQQLPYLDYVQTTVVEDAEMVNMKVISGECDVYTGSIDNISLYREAEDVVSTYLCSYYLFPSILWFDMDYEEDPAVAEAINNETFRKALGYAIDNDELLDAVYMNIMTPSRQEYVATYDPDLAMEMLDSEGFVDINGDGYRETPSGLELNITIFNCAEYTDQVPVCELLAEYFRDIGLRCEAQTIDRTYLGTMKGANQLAFSVGFSSESALWTFMDWGMDNWVPVTKNWYTSGGLNDSEASKAYEMPDEDMIKFFQLFSDCNKYIPEITQAEIIPQMQDIVDENAWYLVLMSDPCGSFVVHNRLGNVSENDPSTHNRLMYAEMYFDRTYAK